MKKLIMVAGVAGSLLCSAAATYEENLALVRTPADQITAANAQAICDAAVALTNYQAIAQVRDKGFVTFEQVAEMVSGKPYWTTAAIDNARVSSNETIRVAAFDNAVAMLKISEFPHHIYADWDVISFSQWITPDKRIAAVKELIAANKKLAAIHFAYGALSCSVLKGKTDKNYPGYNDTVDYASFAQSIFEDLYQEWIAAEPRTFNKRLNSFWQDGGDIVKYLDCFNDDRLNNSDVAKKCAKYTKDGQQFFYHGFMNRNTKVYSAMCYGYLESGKFGNENLKIRIAEDLDKITGNKDATRNILWPLLTDDTNKIKVALYLNDVDKLIDTLKVVSDKLDAKVVESVIAPLNNINAGYRTEDIRLSLMNLNKKYTLKLYDDRDTWEPILSKIRAMIDAL